MSEELKSVINQRAQTRGGMHNRAIAEFGTFLNAMEKFLMYGDKTEWLSDFQEEIEKVGTGPFSGHDINDYITLFAMYDNFTRTQFEKSEAFQKIKEKIEAQDDGAE